MYQEKQTQHPIRSSSSNSKHGEGSSTIITTRIVHVNIHSKKCETVVVQQNIYSCD